MLLPTNRNLAAICSVLICVAISYQPCFGGVIAFSTNFDAGAPTEFSGVTTVESVQGYSGIGPIGNQFSGDFLRNTTGGSPNGTPSSPTILTLTGLPGHTSLDLDFLLAIIDTWDGTTSSAPGAPRPDLFNVTVDGISVFSETLENFNGGGTQTYSPPSGVLLTPGSFPELGFLFNGNPPDFGDSAYNMGVDPAFTNIPHTDSTLSVSWFANGGGWQGGPDETWAIDNVAVTLNGATIPEPLSIDIKPQSCPNPINTKSKGVLPVAILGTNEFDVLTIDPASIRLAGVAPIRSSYEDVATPAEKVDECDCTDEGPDGFLDLALKFDTQEIISALGAVSDGDEIVLTVTGQLSDDTEIEGSDCVLIISNGKP